MCDSTSDFHQHHPTTTVEHFVSISMSDHLEDLPTDMPSSNRQAACRKPGSAAGAEAPKRTRRHRSGSSPGAATMQPRGTLPAVAAAGPCGACKFLRRRCVSGCVFAPHFGTEQGTARFAAVHKVFGASNVSKLLHRVPVPRRGDAAATICFEAQARLSDPVYGCVPTIIALQQQMHLLSSRVATDNVPRCSQQQQQHVMPSRPAYSTNSPASGAFPLLGSSCFPSGLCFAGEFPRGLGTLRLWQPSSSADADGDDEDGGSRDSFADERTRRSFYIPLRAPPPRHRQTHTQQEAASITNFSLLLCWPFLPSPSQLKEKLSSSVKERCIVACRDIFFPSVLRHRRRSRRYIFFLMSPEWSHSLRDIFFLSDLRHVGLNPYRCTKNLI
ncbi:hypothetical protein Taro_037905 [Colocasia esculenta]|uniref:LOB domain-containing protein n=1 Tax=Colocasia esculenta TaxID=4460 RepID=A0A843W6T3_COLES|nr:hypothetical protein [Colocasia esculenta]